MLSDVIIFIFSHPAMHLQEYVHTRARTHTHTHTYTHIHLQQANNKILSYYQMSKKYEYFKTPFSQNSLWGTAFY